MNFELLSTDANTHARAGRITTDHGVIETPIFMPVGTVASVKGYNSESLPKISMPILSLEIHIISTCALRLLYWSRQEAYISLCTGTEISLPTVGGIKYILFPVPER